MTTIEGGLARWVVRRRGVVAVAWTVAAAILLPLAGGVERHLQVGARVEGSESERVERMLVERFATPFARYAVLVVAGTPSPRTPEGAAVLKRVASAAAGVPGVTRTFSWLDARDTMFVAGASPRADAATTFVVVGLDATRGTAADALVPALRAATAPLADSLRAAYPAVALDWTGEAALNFDIRRASAADAASAERRVLPLTLLLLLVAFGAAVAAVLPVAAGSLSIALSLGAAAVAARFFPLSILLQNVVSMLGLGLGIDYALLLVSRFRESLARGLAPDDAAVEAAMHGGHSILLSGLAVAIGFAALLAVPLGELRSVAAGGLLVVVVSMLVATTLLPGVLAWLGGRVDVGRLRRARHAVSADDGDPRWRRWGLWVGAHPWRVLLATGAPLALLVAQSRRLETGLPRGDWLPPAMESARGVHALAAMGRSGVVQTVRVVLELPRSTSAFGDAGWRATARLDSALAADPRVARTRSLPALLPGGAPASLLPLIPSDVRAVFVSRDERAALVELVPREGIAPADLTALVRSLRSADAAHLTGLADSRLAVGGLPAFNADYESAIAGRTPLVVALVLGGTFVVLLVGFRSVLVPLKAIALNLVSVGGAFGAVTLVFQDGHGARLVGLAAPLDGTFPAVPLLVFCIVFGLSMDYEVFLVSRVAEARRRGAAEGEALAEGMARTGRVITSAAAIMIVVFAAFTVGDFVLMKILGFALAVAVLLDATVVRAALGPALLALAGRWNWWPGHERRGEDRSAGAADFAAHPPSPEPRAPITSRSARPPAAPAPSPRP